MSTTRPAKRRATPAPPPEAPARARKPPLAGSDLLKAGLKALDDVRGEVATRHSRFFEALLGIERSAEARKARELFKMPTFEDLFDERVGRSLERLGISQALDDLRAQMTAIDERLRRLEQGPAQPRKPRSKR